MLSHLLYLFLSVVHDSTQALLALDAFAKSDCAGGAVNVSAFDFDWGFHLLFAL